MVSLGLMVMTMSGRGEVVHCKGFCWLQVSNNGCKVREGELRRKFFKLPAASAVMICLESCLLIAGCIMMISIGFNAAVSVRVSNELRAGHDKSAAFSIAVVNLVSFILYLIAAIVVLALRNVISYAFTDGETVARAVSELCPLLAFSLILNGIQPVLSGNMVGVDSRHTGANHYFGMGDLSDRLEGATPFFS
ncbi:hypothetical protein HYC85_014420 [Camellia sinensis]|uniref:Protein DETOXIFICATION n=1 Tax=Camellia sinensis TaxID=4442 RepID=A0A7J7H652_CAMSI|nr:hypothetical protein HYC85_014420 [Camellia sinensis]